MTAYIYCTYVHSYQKATLIFCQELIHTYIAAIRKAIFCQDITEITTYVFTYLNCVDNNYVQGLLSTIFNLGQFIHD